MDATSSPSNKGHAQGQKRPLTPGQVAVLKEVLSNLGRLRDLVLFSLALDTLLRASDLLSLRVADVQDAAGEIRNDFAIQQRKTSRTLKVSLSDHTRIVVARYIQETGKAPAEHLFTPPRSAKPLTRRSYARLVKQWAGLLGIKDAREFSTHSLRRTRAAFLYEQSNNLEVVRRLLGHRSLTATSAYLGIDDDQALAIAKKFQL
jgi:integrase